MPVRRTRTVSPPLYSFVMLEPQSQSGNWTKVVSGSARSHAAYWGGPSQVRRKARAQKPRTAAECGCRNVLELERLQGAKDMKEDQKLVPGYFPLPRSISGIQSLALQTFPISSSVMDTVTDSSFANSHYLLSFLDSTFIQRSSHDDSSLILDSFLLLSYAHYMALTGSGAKSKLLSLKDEVIKGVGKKLKSTTNVPDLSSLIGIQALQTPIVCLVTQELPHNLNVRDYVLQSITGECCSPTSAATASESLSERVVHQQFLETAICNINIASMDSEAIAPFTYVSNSMKM
jgi:hypothetical protein